MVYFEYAKSMAAYEETNYNPLAEKVTVYSNVANGMGLVTGQSTTQMELDFSHLVE